MRLYVGKRRGARMLWPLSDSQRLLKTDPAGSIASWDWGKSEQGGFYQRAYCLVLL